MAIDTRNKRASVINYDRWGRVFPANSFDRVHVGTKYAGIAGAGAGSIKKIPWQLFIRRHT